MEYAYQVQKLTKKGVFSEVYQEPKSFTPFNRYSTPALTSEGEEILMTYIHERIAAN